MEQLLEFIKPDNVVFGVKSGSKTEIIKQLLDNILQSSKIEASDYDEILEALLKREKSMSTGIGSNVAIPHCSIEIVDDIKCAIGLSEPGIEFESIDNLPVQIFILLIVPKSKFQDHIKTLAVIAKTLNDKNERDKLVSCHSYNEIINTFKSVTN